MKDTNSHITGKNTIFDAFIKDIINFNNSFNNTTQIDVKDIRFQKSNNPRVYIYNTHDKEEYVGNNVGVIAAAKVLENNLEKLGVNTIVEDNIVSQYAAKFGSDNNQGYTISRGYIENILNIYPDLELIIDLHRDSLSRENTYTTIDGINYAKVLFVQGTRYNTYKDNMDLVIKISDKLKEKYPSINKGIMTKNYIYNQDINKNIILLELGSNNNTWEEVTNTINVLSPIIKEVLDEKKSN